MEKKGVAIAGSAAQLLFGTNRISQTPSIAHKAHSFKRPPEAHADLLFWQCSVLSVKTRPLFFLK
jgi:hypothetical protein